MGRAGMADNNSRQPGDARDQFGHHSSRGACRDGDEINGRRNYIGGVLVGCPLSKRRKVNDL